jgi:uncharacterized membrane protein YsdA (DUF1294 family)/cold shock CspA family protein
MLRYCSNCRTRRVDAGAGLAYPPSAVSQNEPSQEARQEGRVVAWDEAKAFGFAEVAGARDHVFIHVKFLRHRQLHPKVGDIVRFTPTQGRNGRTAGSDIELVGAPPPAPRPPPLPRPATTWVARSVDYSRLFAAVVILGGALIAVGIGRAPLWVAALYFAMGIFSGLLYRFDKVYARDRRFRVREFSLHLADAAFGIAGGLFAQHVFRHKTRKRSFRYMTRLIFVIHATFLAGVLGGLVPLDRL